MTESNGTVKKYARISNIGKYVNVIFIAMIIAMLIKREVWK